MPLTSTTMSLPTSMPQSWASAIRLVSGGLSGFVRRIEHQQQLAALVEIRLQRVDFRREEIGPRSGDDDHRRVVGHRALLREDELLDGVVLAAERFGDRAVAVALAPTSCPFAVALREVDLPLLAGDDLDDAVGDVLLGVRRDALGAALVVEDDRAVLLNLVLLRDRRLLVGIDVLGRSPASSAYSYSFSRSLIALELGLLREDHASAAARRASPGRSGSDPTG